MTPPLPFLASPRFGLLMLVMGLLPFPASDAHATERMTCEVARFGGYADAQARWQRDLTELITSRHPDLAEVASLYRDDQLVRIELRRRVVKRLGEEGPQALDAQRPLRRWGLLDAAGEDRLAERDPGVARLLEQRRAARERPPHPDGDQLRRIMREELMHQPAYLELLERLTTTLAEAEAVTCD